MSSGNILGTANNYRSDSISYYLHCSCTHANYC